MWWSKQKVRLNQHKIPHKRKIKLPTGHTLTFVPSWKKPRMQNYLKKKRRNSVPRTSLPMLLNRLIPNLYGEYKVVHTMGYNSRRSWIRPNRQIATKSQDNLKDNQEADYDKNYNKLFNRDRIFYPSSKSMPAINIMYNKCQSVYNNEKVGAFRGCWTRETSYYWKLWDKT